MVDRTRIREVYAEAASLPEARRADYLNKECAGDDALRAEVESLLAAAASRPDFMAEPTGGGPEGRSLVEAPGTQVGAYRLLEDIGQGGFGSVFMAQQESPIRRRVALKIIKLGMDTRGVIARFEAERQALAIMDHEHIAKVYDAGTTQSGRPYFVMELVQGEPITKYCDNANMSIAERLDVFVQVCRAVQHAHSKGIIHRDIKPSNILVSTQDGRPHAKVIDFGIAKATEQRLTEKTHFTEFRQMIGTPEYMSPEQAGCTPDIDARSDVYSLGVLLYELLTGATPFDAKELRSVAYAEIQRIIREVDPPKPSTRLSRLGTLASVASLRRTLPDRLSAIVTGDLDWIAMKAMDKDRGRRYDTASALATDIERHLGGEPVSAAPPSRGYRVRKFVRRNRVAVMAGAAVGAALVLGVVGTTMGMMKAKREAARAEEQRTVATHEAEHASAINEFMREVLTSVEPQQGGANIRLIDVLVNASETASQRFAEIPLLEAQVQDLLAGVYSKIGQYGIAKIAADRSHALYLAHAGADAPRTLIAQHGVIGAALNLNRTDEAEPLVSALLPRVERVLGSDDLTTLKVRRSLATVHMLRGRIDDAERLFLELREHPRLANEDQLQAAILFPLCRISQRRALAQTQAEREANWRRTVEMASECVERSVRASGATSADAYRARALLAQALCDAGSVREAADLARAILAETEGRLEPCHINRRNAMTALADALAAIGEFGEPADLYLRIIECGRSAPASDSITLVSNIGDSLKYFERAGRPAEGESLAREGLVMMSKFGGAHASTTAIFDSYLARFASMLGRTDEAERGFAALLATEGSLPGVQLRTRLHLFYARHLIEQKRYEDAERSLKRAEEIRGQRVAGSRDRTADEVLCGFIALYEAWQRPQELKEYLQRRRVESGIPPIP